jgi:hypothetical protein
VSAVLNLGENRAYTFALTFRYRSEDEEEEDEDDEGSSVEEEEDDETTPHHSALGHGSTTTHELAPAYTTPGQGSGVQVGSNGYAVSLLGPCIHRGHHSFLVPTAREEV